MNSANTNDQKSLSGLHKMAAEYGVDMNSCSPEQQKLITTLFEQANYDALTGLKNRRAFNRSSDDKRHDTKGSALFLIDFDKFKNINDTYGHMAGDTVLHAISKRLENTLRASDEHPYRLGGDEFAVVAHGCDGPGAGVIAQKIEECFDEPIAINDTLSLIVGGSVGYRYYADGLEDGHFNEVDDLLYKRKMARRYESQSPFERAIVAREVTSSLLNM